MSKSENSQHRLSICARRRVHTDKQTRTNFLIQPEIIPNNPESTVCIGILFSLTQSSNVNTVTNPYQKYSSLPLRISVLYWRRLVLCLRGRRPSL